MHRNETADWNDLVCEPYFGEPPRALRAAGYALAGVLLLAVAFVPKPLLAFLLLRCVWRRVRRKTGADSGGKARWAKRD